MKKTIKGMVPIVPLDKKTNRQRDIILDPDTVTCLNSYNALITERSIRQNDEYRVGRLELQVSPYIQQDSTNMFQRVFTQDELNMRRKIEILKYNKNAVQTKLNKLSYLSGTASSLSVKRQSCPNDDLLPSLTSSCNIPGPVQIIQYNEEVPLYNYKTNVNSEN